jgi:anthranilate synthase component 2
MNIAYGGTISHTRPLHGKTSLIQHDGKGIFRGLENPLVGGRYHSLAIDRLSAELDVSARTEDGVIMGVRHRNRPHCGLQFHPESVLTPSGMKLISNWIEDVVGRTH